MKNSQKILFDNFSLIEKAIEELKEFAIFERFLILTSEGYKWSDTGEYLGERAKLFEKEYYCPECGKSSKIHPVRNENNDLICSMVIGRRGWRQLGVYDG